ncbi:hypothetical protein JCM19240_3487 [Vibrio maritimus]|uniref:Uncharacterized protein n=1 Tax=Vibrio maritimus TaxID=990268 RepID=A0A090TW31_9VIBR|nr:hypothetical protein JCM19240_3487 [Vibrio maritimus]
MQYYLLDCSIERVALLNLKPLLLSVFLDIASAPLNLSSFRT